MSWYHFRGQLNFSQTGQKSYFNQLVSAVAASSCLQQLPVFVTTKLWLLARPTHLKHTQSDPAIQAPAENNFDRSFCRWLCETKSQANPMIKPFILPPVKDKTHFPPRPLCRWIWLSSRSAAGWKNWASPRPWKCHELLLIRIVLIRWNPARPKEFSELEAILQM